MIHDPTDLPNDATLVRSIEPPERGFYSKILDYRGIPIKGSAAVSDDAMLAAWRRLDVMLARTPIIVENLRTYGAELHIIAQDEVRSDLPENQHRKRISKKRSKAKNDWDRKRGLGGIYPCCGEENLLKLPSDRNLGRDICIHEFAHTILTFGTDPRFRTAVRKCYSTAIRKGLWTKAYASTSVHEYFAELTTWFFGSQGDPGKISPAPKPGRLWLQDYDSAAFEIIQNLFEGRTELEKVNLRQLVSTQISPDYNPQWQSGELDRNILFANRRNTPIKVYWLDSRGDRQFYAQIGPSSSWATWASATHHWLVTDLADNPLGVFVADEEDGLAELR